MKPLLFFASLLAIVLVMATSGFAQGCAMNIAGEWQAAAPGAGNPNLYHFGSDGIVIVSSGAQPAKELGRASYKLDDSQPPKAIEFKRLSGAYTFPLSFSRMEITSFGNASFTGSTSGSPSVTWTRKDSYKYFVVLAAHRGSPPHNGGPAFALLMKSGENKTQIETFGLYYEDGQRFNGPVPEELYRQFIAKPLSDQDTMLRLQVTSQDFARSMTILQTWQKRARERALLFPEYSYLNVIVPLKEIAESLNQCGDTINLYKLTWMVDDELGANVPEWELAFQYVKKLRQLNEPLNITDEKFQQGIGNQMEHSQLSAK